MKSLMVLLLYLPIEIFISRRIKRVNVLYPLLFMFSVGVCIYGYTFFAECQDYKYIDKSHYDSLVKPVKYKFMVKYCQYPDYVRSMVDERDEVRTWSMIFGVVSWFAGYYFLVDYSNYKKLINW